MIFDMSYFCLFLVNHEGKKSIKDGPWIQR